ncbi:FAD dependent oxidoreductase [Aspergillus bertholletiae]|uniref:FAD dependent oxidoreductase n=1 Tax=Aspergillus bertholletiae TaxID=1226010 RepID=A0A5N7BC30_9EURO|nr:FAD dependent oxidoreductase [Aspergillus bertholletiae]
MKEESILIAGTGTFGVSAAYHLARSSSNPSRITLLDRGAPPSTPAASTDINKIIRADYSDPLYMSLRFEAIEAWKSLPFFQDAGVYHQCGWIAMDKKDSDQPRIIRKNFCDSSRDDVVIDMTEEEVKSRWGGLLQRTDCSPFGSYYFNPSAGWVDTGKALAIMADEAVKMGVKYEIGEARRIIRGEDGAHAIETDTGAVFKADKILLATGAWTGQLMSSIEDELQLPDEERVEHQASAAGVCVAHFQLRGAEKEAYAQLPVFVYGEQGEVLPPTDSGVLKFTFATSFKNITRTASGHEISVPVPDQEKAPLGLQKDSINFIKPRLPQVLDDDRKPDYYRLCWDSISPDQQPLITQHPNPSVSNLYFAIGGSFHCYKFLPIIGKYVANVINGVSNGLQKDQAWAWKSAHKSNRGVHETLVPTRLFREFV